MQRSQKRRHWLKKEGGESLLTVVDVQFGDVPHNGPSPVLEENAHQGTNSVYGVVVLQRHCVGTEIKEGIGEALREVIIPNKADLEQYLLPQIDLEKTLTNNNLEKNKLILDEALMLAWLTDPYNRN